MGRDTLFLGIIALGITGMEAVNDRAAKLPSRDTLLEEDIELSVSPALWLGKTEERPDKAAKARSGVEKTTLCAPIPSTGVEHTWSNNIADDRTDVVEVPGQDDSLLAKTSGWNLCDDGVTDRSDRTVVCGCKKQEHGADTPLRANVAGWNETETSDDTQQHNHGEIAIHVQCAASYTLDEDPGHEDTHATNCVLS